MAQSHSFVPRPLRKTFLGAQISQGPDWCGQKGPSLPNPELAGTSSQSRHMARPCCLHHLGLCDLGLLLNISELQLINEIILIVGAINSTSDAVLVTMTSCFWKVALEHS